MSFIDEPSEASCVQDWVDQGVFSAASRPRQVSFNACRLVSRGRGARLRTIPCHS